jgi:hypothetical protein
MLTVLRVKLYRKNIDNQWGGCGTENLSPVNVPEWHYKSQSRKRCDKCVSIL